MKCECKPWCGTDRVPAMAAYYTRRGRYYCRDRCVRAAVKADKAARAAAPVTRP